MSAYLTNTVFLVGLLVSVGCGGAADSSGGAGGNGGASGTGRGGSAGDASGGAATGGQNVGGGSGGGAAGSGGSAVTGGAGGTNASGGSAGGNPDPTLCGGAYPDPCAEGKYCRFLSGCGTVGHCTRMPSACELIYAPVCGCDGITHGNDCAANSAGTSARDEGECDPAQQFPCGPFFCNAHSYCLDKGPERDLTRYACVALPEACAGTPSCECLGEIAACFVGHECQATAPGVTVTCN